MELDYYKIGQRIRKYRKACALSQEQLADKVGISVTHLSHAESGNTKISLSVFVKIADALSIQTDALLSDIPKVNRTLLTEELISFLESCSTQELYILLDTMKAIKISLEKYNN